MDILYLSHSTIPVSAVSVVHPPLLTEERERESSYQKQKLSHESYKMLITFMFDLCNSKGQKTNRVNTTPCKSQRMHCRGPGGASQENQWRTALSLSFTLKQTQCLVALLLKLNPKQVQNMYMAMPAHNAAGVTEWKYQDSERVKMLGNEE